MSRNGSGTMSVINTFSPGDTITASSTNANNSDFASELTNSVAVDGQSTMSGSFKAANGTAAAPSITFGSDTNSGIFHKSADVIGISVGGSEVGYIDSNGFSITASSIIPSGTLMLFQQTAAPTGWTKQTTHNDKALRVVSGTASSGGSTAFSSVMAARTIAQANLPNVNFTISGTAISTKVRSDAGGQVNPAGNYPGNDATTGQYSSVANNSFAADFINISNYGTAASGGSGTALDFAIQYVDLIIASKD